AQLPSPRRLDRRDQLTALSFAEIVVRALHLGGLALAPGSFAPEPTSEASVWRVLVSMLGLAAPVAFAAWLWRRYRTPESFAAAIAMAVAFAVLCMAAMGYSGDSAPLLRGYYVAAPFVWIALSLVAATIAGLVLGA